MEFWQLVRIIRQNWKLIGILVVVCVVISLFLNLTKVKLYDASALIQVSFSTTNELEGTPDYDTKFTLFGTIQQAATSDLALRTVAEKNGIATDNIKVLRQTIKVLPVDKSEYLKITVTAGNEKAAIGAANDLAAYVKEASNKRWLTQLDGILKYNEGQLKTAQDNYQAAIQGYEEAKQKYADLAAQAQQQDSDAQAKQIADANNKVIAAQDAYSKANSTIPKDNAAIDLAKSNLDRAQRDLDALQQAALSPTDPVKQAQRSAELNQNSGLDDALTREKNAKGKVDQLQGQIELAKSLQAYPDLHAASVTIVDPAKTAEFQGSQLPLFVGAAVVVALALGVVLAVLINYLDRGLHSVGAARELYRQPVLAGIPLFRPDKNAKKKLTRPGKNGKAEPEALPEPVSAEELTGLPEYAMESFRMLANSVLNRHHNEIPAFTMSQVRAALPAGVAAAGAESVGDGEVVSKPNGNGSGNGHNHGLSLAELSEVRDMVVDPGGTTQPHPVGLLVTATATGAGKTTVVANLGTALAEAGYRTLLIDCNRRNPALLSSFGLNGNGNGKDKDKKKKDQTEEQPVGEPGRIYNTEYPELDLLPYSSLPIQPSGVVRLADMATMLHKLEGDYQLMICDTPALAEASDAMGLVQHFPNVIYVVDGRKANVAQDQEKLHSLTTGDASLEGLVVNWMQKQS